jgi:hypothetical protein
VNILSGPGAQIVNLGMFKRVVLRENLRLQVEATATNSFNHPNFGVPRLSITSSGPGTITGTNWRRSVYRPLMYSAARISQCR